MESKCCFFSSYLSFFSHAPSYFYGLENWNQCGQISVFSSYDFSIFSTLYLLFETGGGVGFAHHLSFSISYSCLDIHESKGELEASMTRLLRLYRSVTAVLFSDSQACHSRIGLLRLLWLYRPVTPASLLYQFVTAVSVCHACISLWRLPWLYRSVTAVSVGHACYSHIGLSQLYRPVTPVSRLYQSL